MKQEEEIAKRYFEKLGYSNVIYEPKGNRPPDLLLNNEIAVEVRRLNQFHNSIPLERVGYSLHDRLEKILKTFPQEHFLNSAFISLKYSRPLKVDRILEEKIKSILSSHLLRINQIAVYRVTDNLSIEIFPTTEKYDTPYLWGTTLDFDQGGFVLSEIVKSLSIIIPEKNKKIEKYRSEYPIWWLALVDYIGYGLSEDELKSLLEYINFEIPFEKIVFISPLE